MRFCEMTSFGRGEDRAKNGQSKPNVRKGRTHFVQASLPHLDDVVGVAQRGKQGSKQQGNPRHFVALEVKRYQQGTGQNCGPKGGPRQLAQDHADVAVLILQPLGQTDEQEDEHGKRHLHQVVGSIQVGSRGKVMLRQVAKEPPTDDPFSPRQQGRKGFKKVVEDRYARLPRDVHRPQHEKQRTHEHPELPGPQGILFFVVPELFAKGADRGGGHDAEEGQKPKGRLTRRHQSQRPQREASVDFP